MGKPVAKRMWVYRQMIKPAPRHKQSCVNPHRVGFTHKAEVSTQRRDFKAANDNFGHLFGDQVLVAVSNILRTSFRHGEDLVARFGGEEFVVVLPRLDLDAAREAAERICRHMRRTKLATPNGGSPLRVTISCGVRSGYVSGMNDPSEMIVLADQALYLAKQSGRDQVCWTTHS